MKKNTIFWTLGALFLANIFAWSIVYDLNRTEFLEVNFFDVGQGDAIFIETPENYQILIDGGPDSAILEKLGKEMPFWDRSIDLIILTHPEHDHIAGLLEVLERYQVDCILWTGIIRDTAEYEEWKDMIKEEGTNIKIAQAGQKIITPQVFIDILHPRESLEGQEFDNNNNTSIISRLNFGETPFVFTGDAYKSVERELVGLGVEIDCDVLKIGHHGSKTSTSKELLEEVTPEIAIISSGKDNAYGHPHQETLDVLTEYGIRILRTDQLGDIKIISSGKEIITKP